MSFGNVPRDLNVSSLATLRSTASKSINGLFSADIRQVGALVQYQRSPDVWVTAEADTVPATQLGDLYTLPGPITTAQLSLSLDGSVLAVGLAAVTAGSSLSILSNTAGFYTQQAIPLPPDAVGTLSCSVSLSDSGQILAFGSPADNTDVGAVWVYADIAGVWTLQGTKITGPGEIGAGNFGQTLSLSGNGTLLAVGSPADGTAGAVYIFNIQYTSAPVLVARIVGTPLDPGAVFGRDVAFSADGYTLAVGATGDLGGSGSAFIFTKTLTQSSQWTQQAKFTAPSAIAPSSFFGNQVSLSADGNVFSVSSSKNAVIFYRSAPQNLGPSATLGPNASWSAGSLLQLPYDLVGPFLESFAILSQDGNTLCFSYSKNNADIGASWIFTQGPPGTWTQNGPGFIGTGAPPAPPPQQGKTTLSGDGKTAAAMDDTLQGLLWVFV